MIVILDNIIFSLQRKGGISRVWRDVIRAFADGDVVTLSLNSSRLPFLLAKFISIFPAFLYNGFKRHIFFSSYYRFSIWPTAVNVILVHDFIYEKFSPRLTLGVLIHKLQKRFAILAADQIVCISENTKRDLLSFFPQIDPTRVLVVSNCLSPVFEAEMMKYSSESGFQRIGLYVGSRGYCKNFELVVDLLRHDPKLTFVVVTSAFSEEEKIAYGDVLSRLKLRSDVSDSELVSLYRNVDFLFFPSKYEGFGLPVIESFACGTPVILPKSHCFPEVAGKFGLFYNDSDGDILGKIVSIVDSLAASQIPRDELKSYARKYNFSEFKSRYMDIFGRF